MKRSAFYSQLAEKDLEIARLRCLSEKQNVEVGMEGKMAKSQVNELKTEIKHLKLQIKELNSQLKKMQPYVLSESIYEVRDIVDALQMQNLNWFTEKQICTLLKTHVAEHEAGMVFFKQQDGSFKSENGNVYDFDDNVPWNEQKDE